MNYFEDHYCNATKASDGKPCRNKATRDDGRCYSHSEETAKDRKKDARKGVKSKDKSDFQSRIKHGVYMDRSSYYNHLEPEEQEWIDDVMKSFLAEATFDESHLGKMELLEGVVIDMHKIRAGNEYIYQKGLTQKRTKGFSQDGRPMKEDDENCLHLTLDRLQRKNIKTLKELGFLGDSPSANNADAIKSLADVLSGKEE